MKKTTVLILLILLVQTARGQLYISPGIQLGYVPGEGSFKSFQVTVGTFSFRSNKYPNLPTFPGITIGVRRYQEYTINFFDIQFHNFYTGMGVGYVQIRSSDQSNPNASPIRGFRGKLWAGAFINVTYDFYKIPNNAITHNLGLIAVLPLLNYNKLIRGAIATCFAEGTEITMADGSLKSIEDIQIGDRVLSYNLETGKTESDEVLELYSPTNNNMMRMEFSDGTVIHSTFDHPYYVENKGWCSLKPEVTNDLITNISDVGQLEEGDVCHLMKHGQLTEVVFVDSQRIPTFQRTYTIKKLKKNNTFFAEGILVGVETVKETESKTLLGYLK